MSSIKLEKTIYERDLLKKENYVLQRENKRLEQALKKKRVLEKQLVEMMSLQEQELEELKKRIDDLERREKQLPHIILAVWKLLSESQYNPRAKKIFSLDSAAAIETIAHEFALTIEQAKSVWNLLIYWR